MVAAAEAAGASQMPAARRSLASHQRAQMAKPSLRRLNPAVLAREPARRDGSALAPRAAAVEYGVHWRSTAACGAAAAATRWVLSSTSGSGRLEPTYPSATGRRAQIGPGARCSGINPTMAAAGCRWSAQITAARQVNGQWQRQLQRHLLLQFPCALVFIPAQCLRRYPCSREICPSLLAARYGG